MKNISLFIISLLLLASCKTREETMNQLIDRVMLVAVEQGKNMAKVLPDEQLPRSVDKNGKLVTSNIYWWCSGFYPGTLWYIYEYSGDENILQLAKKHTELLDSIQYVTNDHDVGFQLFCSYGNGYRLAKNPQYKDVLVQGAKSLSTRFNPIVGCTLSWDFNDPNWRFPVIIDNIMNMELLLWVAKETSNDSLYNMACSHANTTIKNHFRKDYSCYHLVDYDTVQGTPRQKQTVQGANNESSWARGQAWALYGYTMMYRYTSNQAYLNQAKNVAEYLLNHPNMPQDGIPYWDYNAPKIPNDFRDASAAAIMASGLIELSECVSKDDKEKFLSFAEKQLRTLASSEYLAEPGTNSNFLLKHSVGNLPGNSEVDVPLTYADYYFVEALVRYKKYNSEK